MEAKLRQVTDIAMALSNVSERVHSFQNMREFCQAY